jgi:hypothetical protein
LAFLLYLGDWNFCVADFQFPICALYFPLVAFFSSFDQAFNSSNCLTSNIDHLLNIFFSFKNIIQKVLAEYCVPSL